MKILLLDNSSLTPINGDYYIDSKTGSFAKELQEHGNEIRVYGQSVLAEDTSHTFPLRSNGIAVTGINRRRNKIKNYLLLYLKIIPEIRKSDFVYIFYPSAFRFVSLICWLLRKPYGLYIRGEQGIESKTSQWIYRKAQAILTVTDFFTKKINRMLSEDKAQSIRPMISYTEKDIVEDRLYRQPQKFNLLYLGRITEDKGIVELLKAVKILKDKEYDFKLRLVGSGGFMENAKYIVQDLKIENFVSFLGVINDPQQIKEYYLKADVYVLPSYHEGFPRTLYEAMLFGTPIITTFVGGIPAIMKEDYNCLRIEPQSVDSLVGEIEFAFNLYEKMATYARNGTETVKEIIDSKRLSHAEHLNQIIISNAEKS